MRHKTFILIAALALGTLYTTTGSTQDTKQIRIDGLESARVGKFPSNWRTWPFKRGKTAEIYHVDEEGDTRFIRARDDKDYSLQALRDFNWPIDRYPYLSWRWRARELPVGAREDDDEKNDSACGVYIIFGRYSGHAMKYVWSSELPIGKEVSRLEGKLKIKILESGKIHINGWRQETVNVPSDYRALFGKELKKNPSGIAILTDANATHTSAACDYTDFTISKEPVR